jgi:phytol kinase
MAPFDLEHVDWLRVAAYLFLSTFVLGNVATYLRRHRGWRDGYTRKLNHFGHLAIALPILGLLPPGPLVASLTVAATLVVIIYAISALSSRPLIHGMVAGSLRDSDAPRRRFFFFMPLIAGNIALVAASFIFPFEAVALAVLTAAVADGLAEPIGLRWGAHARFRVPDPIWGGANTKSLAGLATVFVCSVIICGSLLSVWQGFSSVTCAKSFGYGIAMMVVEALSSRGLDNMNIFLVGAWIGTLLI